MLTGELNDIEDLQIRNTDSLLEYPTLGEALQGLSQRSLARRLQREGEVDQRAPAKLFYQLYGTERALGVWPSSETLSSLDSIINRARPRYDELLKTHATLLRMRTLQQSSSRYRDLAYRVFFTTPALLRNYGLPLPVRLDRTSLPREVQRAILAGPFVEATDDAAKSDTLCVISGTTPTTTGGAQIALHFACPGQSARNRTVEDSAPEQVVNKLSKGLFSSGATYGSSSNQQ